MTHHPHRYQLDHIHRADGEAPGEVGGPLSDLGGDGLAGVLRRGAAYAAGGVQGGHLILIQPSPQEGGPDVHGLQEALLEVVVQGLLGGQLQGGAQDGHAEVAVGPIAPVSRLHAPPGGLTLKDAPQLGQAPGSVQILNGGGMSQKGAQGMALQGNDFLTILHHYYTNVTIQ